MATHRFFILALAALPLLTTGASAQDAWRYRNWDRNGDGIITRAEWRGTAEAFRDLDLNGDGALTGGELREQAADTRTTRTDRWDRQAFDDLDLNNDGRLTRAEWSGDRVAFRTIDRNGDNQVTRGEFMNANIGLSDDRGSDFDQLDTDNSGRVERLEWNGTRASFNRMDANGDGVLTRRELASNDAALASSDPVGSRAIRVDARQPWTNTGIHVNAGDVVTYRARGNMQLSTNPEDRATPAGSLAGRAANNSPRPDQKAGGLLIRIGNGPVGFLGTNGSFTAQNSGEILLGVNDDHFEDNSGGYQVALQTRR
jgi:Ca2+-binding EF-hand superfamily protein